MQKRALILFVRNPLLGKVKTRLAATIGDKKALSVYIHLLQRTYEIIRPLKLTKFVFYADNITKDDLWNGCEKREQLGDDLGERMYNAFTAVFHLGFNNICIIGSDCYDLTTTIIDTAFDELQTHDAVIGGATDGGYYLLGLSKLSKEIFSGIQWSTATVLSETVNRMNAHNFSLYRLPVLNDVDEEKDISFKYV